MQQIKLLVFYLYNKYYPQFREKKTKEKILFKKKLGFNKEFNSQVKTSVIDWKKLLIFQVLRGISKLR